MISFHNVSKSYPVSGGLKTVIDQVSATFPPGRSTAIIGRNGAGKSTLLRLLSGSENPDHGYIERKATASWPLGFKSGLHGSLNGRENIAFISRIYGQNFREMLEFVEDFADIGNHMNDEVKYYSNGMKARLSFGISMAISFDYYLIDEVIAVGDAAFKRKCKQVLGEKLKTATVLLVSHSNSLMREFCDYGMVMEDGQLHDLGNLEDAISYYGSL